MEISVHNRKRGKMGVEIYLKRPPTAPSIARFADWVAGKWNATLEVGLKLSLSDV